MGVPFRINFCGIFEVETMISPETACKVAWGLAGVAGGTAVIAAGAACGNGSIIKLGAGIAAASVLGSGAAVGLEGESGRRRLPA
jgi:hypothetical protein